MLADMFGYAQQLAAHKRREPADDVMTALVQAEVDGERLTDAELKMFFFLLVIAGNDTVRSALPGGVLALVRAPRRRTGGCGPSRRCCRRPSRSCCGAPAGAHASAAPPRVTLELAGRRIRAGDKVVVFHASANHDERGFPDPFRLDLTRAPNPHVSFGDGPHVCLGARFARLQLRVFFTECCRLPAVELGGRPRRLVSNFINGITSLPLRW